MCITIVHIITSLGVGGAERNLSNLVLGMDRNKFCNIVISLQDLGYWGTVLKAQGIQVYALDMQNSPLSIFKIFTLWKLLRKHRPDYVQGWMYHANVAALIVGKLAGIKNIFWNIRCSLMDLSKYKFSTTVIFKSGAWLAKFPTAIINNSQESMQQHIASGYNNKNWLHIPNGFDIHQLQPNAEIYNNFRLQHNLPEQAIIIGMIARYDPMKDHATFLKAAGILAKENPDVYFVCAGRNVNMQNVALKNLIIEQQIANKVLLLDQVNNVHELYPALDYLTQTSVFGEGFPNVVAEAMACGVECFVTDVGDSLAVIGSNGYKIAKSDPAGLAAQWQKAIAYRNVKIPGSQIVRDRIVDNFSLQKIVAIYSEHYSAGAGK